MEPTNGKFDDCAKEVLADLRAEYSTELKGRIGSEEYQLVRNKTIKTIIQGQELDNYHRAHVSEHLKSMYCFVI